VPAASSCRTWCQKRPVSRTPVPDHTASTTAVADTQGRLRATIADTTEPTKVTARPVPVAATTKRLPRTAAHSGGNGAVVHEEGRAAGAAEGSVDATRSGAADGSGVGELGPVTEPPSGRGVRTDRAGDGTVPPVRRSAPVLCAAPAPDLGRRQAVEPGP